MKEEGKKGYGNEEGRSTRQGEVERGESRGLVRVMRKGRGRGKKGMEVKRVCCLASSPFSSFPHAHHLFFKGGWGCRGRGGAGIEAKKEYGSEKERSIHDQGLQIFIISPLFSFSLFFRGRLR